MSRTLRRADRSAWSRTVQQLLLLCSLLLAHTAPAAASCAVLTAAATSLGACDGSILFTVQDADANLDPNLVESITIVVRSNAEPFGEVFPLFETDLDTGVFEAHVPVSSQRNAIGVVFFQPGIADTIRGSYLDADCDQDGDGQTGETDFTDVDGDGVSSRGPNGVIDSPFDDGFDDDNCFDLATGTDIPNPGQEDSDTFCLNATGDTDGMFCVTVADCVAPYDANCRGDRVGDLCDNCPAHLDPYQADLDADGIGDICELDWNPALGITDIDLDGVPNTADNCPTLFNPSQIDSGGPGDPGNGIGNACDGDGDREPFYGVVISAGLNGVLDTTPGMDDVQEAPDSPVIWAGNNGVADTFASGDDIQALLPGQPVDCDPSTGEPDGDGVPDGSDNCPGVCNPTQDDTDNDGIGDACEIAEDYDFDLVQDIVDLCPTVFDPAQLDSDGDGLGDACDPDSDDDDLDGQPDDLVQAAVAVSCDASPGAIEVVDWSLTDVGSGDGDGIADPGEILTLDLVVRNAAMDGMGTLSNLMIYLGTDDPAIACFLDSSAAYGTLAPGEERGNPWTDRFQLLVSTGAEAQTLSATAPRKLELTVFATADDLAGVAGDGLVTTLVDLDLRAAEPPPLGGIGELVEGFEGLPGTPGLTQTFGRSGLTLDDVIPFLPGTNCSDTPLGPADCSLNTANNDWHLHDPASEPANAPDSGKAHSGIASLHLGRHVDPADPSKTTYRFRQLTAFVAPPVNLSLGGGSVEFWHIAQMYANGIPLIGGLSPFDDIGCRDGACDMGSLQVRLDGDPDPGTDAFGPWEVLREPAINPYGWERTATFISACKFDPLDDFSDGSFGEVPGETVCQPSPGFAEKGSASGTDAATCTDSDDDGRGDCGLVTATGPGFTETGATGVGVWVRTRFDLAAFRGRRLQLRWIFTSLAFGEETFLSYLETPSTPGGFDSGDQDDGWWIDDIRFVGLLEEQLDLIPDGGDDVPGATQVTCGANSIAETRAEGDDVQLLALDAVCIDPAEVVVTAGPNGLLDSVATNSCPVSPDDFCLGATARIDGQQDGTLATLGPGETTLLDAHGSTLSPCAGGVPLYEFRQCADPTPSGPCDLPLSASLVQGLSPDGYLEVEPVSETRYQLRVRCSSQPEGTGCEDVTEARVLVYPSDLVGEIVQSTSCETASTGDPARCDAADPLTLSFTKPMQDSAFDGFDLYQADALQLASPLLAGADCAAAAFGVGIATGTPVAVTEPIPAAPAAGEVVFYVFGHRRLGGGTEAPAGFGRAGDGPEPTPRFVTPVCP